ncbi:hypothetical protein OIU77_011236 [Salix suchowensis]|uniref:Uncharacterized protein n=1 Tax=Salix suchowensis TaxID=1278906 RepID=A0ABQ9AB28_9ROSI|nr:hypothetical protein OIU77_011236 [Salix suchowensis]
MGWDREVEENVSADTTHKHIIYSRHQENVSISVYYQLHFSVFLPNFHRNLNSRLMAPRAFVIAMIRQSSSPSGKIAPGLGNDRSRSSYAQSSTNESQKARQTVVSTKSCRTQNHQ